MLQMPSITKANVDKYYDQLFDHADKFVEGPARRGSTANSIACSARPRARSASP